MRLRFQFRLRTLLCLVLIVAVALGWQVHVLRRRDAAVQRLEGLGAGVVREWQYFGDSEACPHPGWMQRLTGLRDSRDIAYIEFTREHPPSDNDLWVLEATPNLKALIIRAGLGDRGCRYLRGLHKLEALNAFDCEVTDAGMENFAALSQLKILKLHGAKVRGSGLRHLRDLPELQSVDLTGSDVETIEPLSGSPKLYCIEARHTPMDELSLHDCPRLWWLEVDNDVVVVSLRNCPELPRVIRQE